MGAGGRYKAIPDPFGKCRAGSCGTAYRVARRLDNVGLRTCIVLRGHKAPRTLRPLPGAGSLFRALAALTFAASSITCAIGDEHLPRLARRIGT